MSDRMMVLIVPTGSRERAERTLESAHADVLWRIDGDETTRIQCIVDSGSVEALVDELDDHLGHLIGFRVVTFPLTSVRPRPDPDELDRGARQATTNKSSRISRDELYAEISKLARVTPVYDVTVILSTLVAAIGLSRDSSAIVIGAMVIAPLLGPNVALALGTALGDINLVRKAVITGARGLAIAFVVALPMGLFLGALDPAAPEISARIHLSYGDLILALASGTAGALCFTSGMSASLVGVMVAVAMMPPLVVFAMLLANGDWGHALPALLLLAANLICVNLSAVATFAVQGVQPRRWWEAERSRIYTRRAIRWWCLLLILAGALIAVAKLLAVDAG